MFSKPTMMNRPGTMALPTPTVPRDQRNARPNKFMRGRGRFNRSQNDTNSNRRDGNSFQNSQPREEVDTRPKVDYSGVIVGTKEWHRLKSIEFPRMVLNTKTFLDSMNPEARDKLVNYCSNYKSFNFDTLVEQEKNQNLIYKIDSWIDQTGWMQIDGGEFHGKWTNPQYKTLFESGKVWDMVGKEWVYFPIADTHDDPIGLALDITVGSSGNYCEIKTNKWISNESTRRWRRRRKFEQKIQDKKNFLRSVNDENTEYDVDTKQAD